MQKVDVEIRRIIDEQYELARKLLKENSDKVEMMTKALLDWETIDAEQIADIMAGHEPRPPKPSSSGSNPSQGNPPAPTAAAPTSSPAQET